MPRKRMALLRELSLGLDLAFPAAMSRFEKERVLDSQNQALDRNEKLIQRRVLRRPLRAIPSPQQGQTNFSVCIKIRPKSYTTASSRQQLATRVRMRIIVRHVDVESEQPARIGRWAGQRCSQERPDVLGAVLVEAQPNAAVVIRREAVLQPIQFPEEPLETFRCVEPWRCAVVSVEHAGVANVRRPGAPRGAVEESRPLRRRSPGRPRLDQVLNHRGARGSFRRGFFRSRIRSSIVA
mmetsp:Transcript_25122/g.56728  ORF Transcript_25122/g.56728 Transcript_25122/m.56728 type:complete len:238 (-) Transcript_25122:1149-1862(-)